MRDPLGLELLALCHELGISPAELLDALTNPAVGSHPAASNGRIPHPDDGPHVGTPSPAASVGEGWGEGLDALTTPAPTSSVPRPAGSREVHPHHPFNNPASIVPPIANEASTKLEQYCSTPLPESGEDCSTVEKRNAPTTARRPVTPSANPAPFCTATNHLGEPCKARSLKTTNLCYHHHPDTAREANIHSRRAGSAPRRPAYPDPFEDLDYSTPDGLRRANETITRLILTGAIPAHRLNQAINALRIAYEHQPLFPPRPR